MYVKGFKRNRGEVIPHKYEEQVNDDQHFYDGRRLKFT